MDTNEIVDALKASARGLVARLGFLKAVREDLAGAARLLVRQMAAGDAAHERGSKGEDCGCSAEETESAEESEVS